MKFDFFIEHLSLIVPLQAHACLALNIGINPALTTTKMLKMIKSTHVLTLGEKK